MTTTNNTTNKFILDIFILHLLSKNWLLIFASPKINYFINILLYNGLKLEKNNPNHKDLPAKAGKLRVLIAPLDWGLGHTTRCIPLAHCFIKAGVTVVFAGNQQQKIVLEQEFPDCQFLHLDGYNIQYSKTAGGLVWKLASQLRPIKKRITAEHQWLLQQTKEQSFDAIISDNRFGLWHPSIPSIFITHQLTIKTPFGWVQKLVQKINYGFINRFSACWVPDMPEATNLAGVLSHPKNLPAIPVSYVGVLSRLQNLVLDKKAKHLFISLSGPEPQRSLLETKILQQLKDYKGTATVVRGLPAATDLPQVPSNVQIHNHLNTAAYNTEMCSADMVISRTGYSTVMDIVAAQQKSILIPTPGQTEQEYLAKYLTENKLALCYTQNEFDLIAALDAAAIFPYKPITVEPLYEKVVADFVKSVLSQHIDKDFNHSV